jgi:peptide/nickel transport system ATP-binding protein
MYLGEIVGRGPVKAMFGNPQHPYTKPLLATALVPDPARCSQMRRVSSDEIRSTIRSVDYVPPTRQYQEVSPGHVVQVWGDDWKLQDSRRPPLQQE